MKYIVAFVCGISLWSAGFAHAGAEVSERETPLEVRFGVFVTSIHDLDLASGRWGIEFFGWLRFTDDQFDPLRAIEVLGSGADLVEVVRRREPDASTYVAFRCKTRVSGNFDLRAYPFDRHELVLNFEFTDPESRVRFVPDEAESRIADFVALRGWFIGNLRLTESLFSYNTTFGHPGRKRSNFSRATLRIPIERHGSAFIIDQFPGFTVCILISALIYLVRWDQLGVRVGMVTSAIFATVGNRYTLNAAIGTEGGFGLVDELTLIAFSSILTALSVSLLVFHLGERYGAKVAWRVDLAVMVVASSLWFGLATTSLLRATA